MTVQEDYIHFLLENKDIISELKEHNTLTYDLLDPIFKVLDFFNEVDMNVSGEDKADITDIFQIGFHYIYSCMDHIKRILVENFDEEIEEFIEHDKNMYLYLKVDEIDTMYDGKNEFISAMLDQLTTTFEYRKKFDDNNVDQVEVELNKAIEELDGERTTTDIFIDLADELNLELF